jgi:hypothetical protein
MSIKKVVFGLSLFLLTTLNQSFSQCCSTGSPVGASVYVGVLNENSLRTIAYYRHNSAHTYYSGTEVNDVNDQLESSNYNFMGFAFGYGITKRMTVETDLGYFFNKTQVFKSIDFTEKGYGLSTGGLTLKYGALVKPMKHFELTLGGGVRYPFSNKPQMTDGVQLSRDVQPSTNAVALSGMIFINKGFPDLNLRVFSINRFDHNFEDKLNYKYGDMLMNSIFVSKQIVKYFMGILQFRSEVRWHDQDDKNKRTNTGNLLLWLSPQLNYAVSGKWNISLMCDIPVYKDYNGKQLTPAYSFAVGLTRDFDLSRKSKTSAVINSIRKP